MVETNFTESGVCMPNQAHDTFVSYAREDGQFALRLAKDLKAAKALVWLDQLDIKPGERWDLAVENALSRSPRMLVVLSPSSIASTNVMDEVSYALEEQKLIIPVLYRDCIIPFRMRRLQFVDFRADYHAPLQSLLQVLAGQTPEPSGGNLLHETPMVTSQADSPSGAETSPVCTGDVSVLSRQATLGRPGEAGSFLDRPYPGDAGSRLDQPVSVLRSLCRALGLRNWHPSASIRSVWFLVGVGAILAAGFKLSPLLTRHSANRSAPLPVAILTSLPGMERAPSFSPDGNQVTYTWSPTRTDISYVCVQMVGGSSAPLRLTPKPASNHRPSWSRDGLQIAFFRREGRSRADILLISPLGGPERVLATIDGLVEAAQVPSLDWSPDGRWIITHGRVAEAEPYGLLLVDTASGEKHLLSASPVGPPWGYMGPAFSPDGRRIVFAQQLSDFNAQLGVWSISSAGQLVGSPKILAQNRTSWFGYPRWTPDGQWIVYTSSQNDTTLWKIPSSGGTPEEIALAGSIGSVLDVEVARRCCRLAFASYVSDPNIWSVQLARRFGRAFQPRYLAGSTRRDGMAQLSPDGTRLAYFSDASGLSQIWMAARDGSNAQQLTHFTEGHTEGPRWSPNSQSLVFESTSSGDSEIYMIDTAGRAPRRLTRHPAADVMPSFSADGNWIYFGSNRSGQFEVWRMNSSRPDEVEQVTRRGGKTAVVSPDGRWIYYQKDYLSGPLYAMGVEGSEELQVVPRVLMRAFSPVRDGVYFVAPSKEDQVEMAYWDGRTKQVKSIAPLGKSDVWIGLSVSADERFFVYSQRDRYESDILLAENFQ
jgi:Tol biopolymer transport system component